MSWDPRSGMPGHNPSPFSSPQTFDPYAQRPRSSSGGWLLLVGGGGALVLVLLCCGGVVGLFTVGMNVIAAEVKEQIRDNEKLREHVGEIESLEVDFMATAAIDDDDTFRYRVKGTKGSGELTVKQYTGDDGGEVVEEATLRLPSGETVQIVP